MQRLFVLSILIIVLLVTTACTGIQSQNQAPPAPLGYIEIPTKDEILANAQFGIEQPEIIYARLLFSREASQAAGVSIMFNDEFYKPDDPVWAVAVKSGNNRVQIPGFGEQEAAGILHIIKAATGDAISMSSIQDIDNDAGLQRLEALPDRYGTIEIQPEPVPTPFTPAPTPTSLALSVLKSPNQDVFTSPLLPLDTLETAMGRHAGVNRINCGAVPIGGETAAVNQCVDDAYQAKHAFTVVYVTQNIDAVVAEGIAGNEQGEMRTYLYTFDPFGSEMSNERECHAIIPGLWAANEMRRCE